ncbi:D-alanyl-D-alanine carboxypeptidase family protein [Ruminiclostridium cellobioparum]|uniref:serine-type D-Ala-D-Ala carboxypeptidase n=1 Tax=Ruminiclostridium cellobioparum subsp. termitidis CT1112 TaxID=1195236 RepID=S0FXQ0_RUMCE|nr:D-alanyl-D-alanine carboxypeptidase family protein [Ruminiclostridium cellobioparum]EMS73894.1 D-alanyl-D-alanine carboxypeptidase [Ruminiclostridium cellobioparum subsp. termitidis CT1112]
MRKLHHKLVLFIILLSAIILNSIPVLAWTPDEELTASSAILMDTMRGQILFEKDADKVLSPSIMCKLMTALITMDKTQLNSKVTISKNAAGINGASLNLTVGNLYTVEDLLYGIMLSPGNDAAIALAEYVGDGDVNKFVGYMNETAKKLMLNDTYFVNPTGLYDEKQFTSVRDIAKLIKSAIANPVFNSVFSSRGIAWINGKDSSVLTNQNKLFWSYNGVDGGKIGTNPKLGVISVTTATRDGRRLVAVVFDKDEESTLSQTTQLFDYGFTNYYNGILVSKDTPLRTIAVQNVDVNLISKIDVYYTYPVGQSYIKDISFTKNEKLEFPIKTDTVAGVLKYILEDGTEIDVDLYSDKEIVPEQDYKTKIKTILDENRDLVLIVTILIVIEFILLFYNIIKLIIKMAKKMGHPSK